VIVSLQSIVVNKKANVELFSVNFITLQTVYIGNLASILAVVCALLYSRVIT